MKVIIGGVNFRGGGLENPEKISIIPTVFTELPSAGTKIRTGNLKHTPFHPRNKLRYFNRITILHSVNSILQYKGVK